MAPLEAPERLAQVFGDTLAHRGPDGEGFLLIPAPGAAPHPARSREEVASVAPPHGVLVHRRLSIIDLATGDQPMRLENGLEWIVFNGEIYNYRELREELQRTTTVRFRTQSDTEVILAVYRHWGIAGFGRMNGMFAFAIYDGERRQLVLARDPVGVKPLYWCHTRSGVAFASEIRPLRATGLVAGDVGREALAQYLFYRFVPSPRTLWRDVHRVPPGYVLRFDARGRLVEEVDVAPPAPVSTAVRGNPGELLAPAFSMAVRRQMLADVPVGAFLSGGLDSSLVVAAMRATGACPQTFGIGFATGSGTTNELPLASRASSLLGTTHAGIEVEAGPYYAAFPRTVLEVEEPLAEAGMLLLSKLAALAGSRVKVVLTGQGADEPLGGYPRHQATRLALALGHLLGRRLTGRLGASRDRLARFFRVVAAPSGAARAAAPFSGGEPSAIGELVRGCGAEVGSEVILDGVSRWWDRCAGMDDMARILYVDVRTSLADDLLLMADKTAMAHGLEARVPFLDLEYLALLESIPGSQRISLWRRRKWIQHAVAQRLIPPSLARGLVGPRNPLRKKLAFEVPVDEWLRRGFGTRLGELIAGSNSILPDYVDRAYLRRTVDDYLRNARQTYRVVLSLYVLEVWLRSHVAGVPAEQLPAA